MTPPAPYGAYAGLVTRAIAIAIDALLIDVAALVVGGAALLIKSVFSLGSGDHALVAGIASAAFVIWVVSYFSVFWTTTGQTPGSRVMQIQVTRSDGSRLHPARALVRLAGMFVSMPLFWGYLPILWSPHRRSVSDLLAGTVVTGAPDPSEVELLPERYLVQRERSGEHGPPIGTRSNGHLAAERGQTIA